MNMKLILFMAVFALSLGFFSYLIPKISANSTSSELVPPNYEGFNIPNQAQLHSDSASTQVGLPVRLIIPKLEVDAKVEYVALAKDKTMAVPQNEANVAWYLLGDRPGVVGTAVIAGHYGWRDDKPLVFAKIDKLRPGDELFIEDDRGAFIKFVVRERRSYEPNANVTKVFNSTDNRAHLNLTTCEGVYDEVTKNYPKRLVVFTDRE